MIFLPLHAFWHLSIANRARKQTIMKKKKKKGKKKAYLFSEMLNTKSYDTFSIHQAGKVMQVDLFFFFLVTQNELIMKMLVSYRYDGYVGVFQLSI